MFRSTDLNMSPKTENLEKKKSSKVEKAERKAQKVQKRAVKKYLELSLIHI